MLLCMLSLMNGKIFKVIWPLVSQLLVKICFYAEMILQ